LIRALEPQGVALAAAAGVGAGGRVVKKDPLLAPKLAGLNIEALAATPDGTKVYIGFRNPLHAREGARHAIVMPLLNAAAVVERGAAPDFGAPLFWNLGGHGLRSMVWSPTHQAFFLMSGGPGGSADWRLYRWGGDAKALPVAVTTRAREAVEGHPEALVEGFAERHLLALTDDGDLAIHVAGAEDCKPRAYRPDGTCRNKDLVLPGSKTFHGFEIAP
jgi:hypothetical protein